MLCETGVTDGSALQLVIVYLTIVDNLCAHVLDWKANNALGCHCHTRLATHLWPLDDTAPNKRPSNNNKQSQQ